MGQGAVRESAGVPPAGEGRQTETNEDGSGYFAFKPVEKAADAQEDDQ